jgi:inner membrane transporter RhtA
MTALAALLFGVNGAVAADLLASMAAANVAQIRAVLAALILFAIALRHRAISPRGRLPGLLALGVVLVVVMVSFFIAISRLGVGPGVTIQFTGPILVLAWRHWVQRLGVPTSAWIAAATALVGVALVSQLWDREGLDLGGLAAAIVAAVTFAAYLLLSGNLGKTLPAITVAAYGFATAGILLLVAVPVEWPAASVKVLSELVWLVTLGTVAPFLLEVAALRRVDAGTVGVVATLEPVIGAAAAWMWLSQALRWWQVMGGMIVIGAVAVVQRYTGGEATPIA